MPWHTYELRVIRRGRDRRRRTLMGGAPAYANRARRSAPPWIEVIETGLLAPPGVDPPTGRGPFVGVFIILAVLLEKSPARVGEELRPDRKRTSRLRQNEHDRTHGRKTHHEKSPLLATSAFGSLPRLTRGDGELRQDYTFALVPKANDTTRSSTWRATGCMQAQERTRRRRVPLYRAPASHTEQEQIQIRPQDPESSPRPSNGIAVAPVERLPGRMARAFAGRRRMPASP